MNCIDVRNRLEVKPGPYGGAIQIPACEPTTSLTAISLSRNMSCKCGIISVKKALQLIPGSRLVRELKPIGHVASGWFFELPAGPPPLGMCCPGSSEEKNQLCWPDWYKILRDNCQEVEVPSLPECAGFDYSGCMYTFDPLRITHDPNMRPNSESLSNIYGP